MTADYDIALLRSSLDQTFAAAGSDASEALDSFGVSELIEEAGLSAVRYVLESQGRHGATSRVFHEVVLRALSVPLADRFTSSILLPISPGAWDGIAGVDIDGQCTLRGIVLGGVRESIVCGVRDAEGRIAVREFDATTIDQISKVAPYLDSRLSIVEVRGEAPAATSNSDIDAEVWAHATTAGRIALAAELIGCVQAMLELAVRHARDRRQFGTSIGSFQAVKHKLAEVAVATEAAVGVLDAVVLSPSSLAGLTVKSLAGAAARLGMKHCLQVLGGIGFTWEHPYHQLHRRAMVLDRLLGSAADLPAVIGAQLMVSGDASALIDIT